MTAKVKVVAEDTYAPIAGLEVELVGTALATTDAKGIATFNVETNRPYDLKVRDKRKTPKWGPLYGSSPGEYWYNDDVKEPGAHEGPETSHMNDGGGWVYGRHLRDTAKKPFVVVLRDYSPPPVHRGVTPSATGNRIFVPIDDTDYVIRYELVGAVTMSPTAFETLSGMPPSMLPEIVSGAGAGTLNIPEANWYYRVLRGLDPSRANATVADPAIAQILKGADIVPKVPLTANFDPFEMTYRHLSPVSDVEKLGTDRISTAQNLEAFKTVLKDRGTGEIVRVDVTRARELGSEFLEHDTVLKYLDVYEKQLRDALAEAQAKGRGKTAVTRLTKRLEWLETGRRYALKFREGQGVGAIPSGAVTPLRSATGSLSAAILREKLFLGGLKFVRVGGKVFLVVGIVNSIYKIASAPEGEGVYVASREAGGWAFSLAGAAVGAEVFGALGAAVGIETGPGAVIIGGIGGIIGGIFGFVAGEDAVNAVAEQIKKPVADMKAVFSNPAKLTEASILLFGSDEAKRAWRELKDVETIEAGGDPADNYVFP